MNSPKIELHIHLEGSISLYFWKNNFPAIYKEILDFKKLPKKSLPVFLQIMTKIHKTLSSPLNYYYACLDVIEQLIAENIQYVELIWAPGGILEFHDYIPEKVYSEIERAIVEKNDQIDVRLLIDIVRNQSIIIAERIIKWLKTYPSKYIVGINFGGNEQKYPVEPFSLIIQEAKDLGLGVSIHAGETTSEEVLMQAVFAAKPHRIGHGTSLYSNENINVINRLGIHVEACPTSNVILGYLKSYRQHPVFLFANLNSSLNTDDRTFFDCNVTSEMIKIITEGIATIKTIAKWQLNAVNASFSRTDISSLLRIKNYWSKVLNSKFDGLASVSNTK